MSAVMVATVLTATPVLADTENTENTNSINIEKEQYDSLKALDDCDVIVEADAEKLGKLIGGVDDVTEDLVIDTENNNKADIVSDDVNIPLSAILENEGNGETVAEVSEQLDNKIIQNDDVLVNSVSLKQLGYEYFVDDKKITLTKSYQSKRLIVDFDELDDDFGATMAVSCGDGKALLIYDSIESTIKAQECFAYEGINACPDRVVSIKSTALDLSNEWGCTTIESNRFISERLSTPGEQIVVAVVDTGVYYNHAFLEGRVLAGGNVIDGGDYNDDNDHGTHVSGIIVNNTPSNVKILPVKAFTNKGSSTMYICALGIRYAADHGAKVINMSFGGRSYFTNNNYVSDIQAAIDYANEKGSLCVAAASNEGSDAGDYWPASCDGVLTVGAVDEEDKLCGFSNYGSVVDVVAPGQQIHSCIAGDNTYARFSGTSMATPFVSAVAGLFLSENSKLTNTQVENKIISSAIDLGVKGKDNVYGAGRIDLGYYLGDRVLADDISLETKEIKMCHSDTFKASPKIITPLVTPSNATDKSFDYSFTQEGIIDYDKGLATTNAPGNTTITLSLQNGKSVSVDFTVTDGANWLDVAAEKYDGGSGTMKDPYLIRTAEQLAKVSKDYYYAKNDNNLYFKQVADIDLAGRQWYPIHSIDRKRYCCRCNYDGGGYNISNLTFNQSVAELELLDVGLFYNNSGQMENINLVDVEINTDCSIAGGIVGYHDGVVRGCSVSGNISSPMAGGIVGDQASINHSVYSTLTIDCYCDAKITGKIVGGIAGALRRGYIANCSFFGSLISTHEKDINGGIAAQVENWDTFGDATGIINCVSSSNIFATKDFHETDGNNLYELIGTQKAVVKNCYCQSDWVVRDVNPQDTDITIVSENFFSNVDNFLNNDSWDSSFLWDFERMWQATPFGIKLKPQSARVYSGDFYYLDLENFIVICGYEGKKTSITFPSYIDNKPVKYVSNNFYLPKATTEITFSNTIEGVCATAFYENFNLILVHFNEGLKFINKYAFYNCVLLQSVELPKSLEHLGKYVFTYCGEMKNIYFKGSLDIVYTEHYLEPETKTVTRYLKVNEGTIDKNKWDGIKYSVYNPDHILEISFYDYDIHYNDVNTISPGPEVRLCYGDSIKLKSHIYNKNAKNKTINWSSNNKKISVSADGTVKLNGEVGGVVTAKAADGSCQAQIKIEYAGCHPYKIVYKGNGATSGSMATQTVPMYEIKNLSANKFARKGYVFIGWATSAKGDVLYSNKESIYALDATRLGKTITLYAKWKPISYKVKFVANGGSGKMNAQSFTYDTAKRLTKNSFKAPKGKVFAGWAKTKNGTPLYTNNQSVKSLTANKGETITLYAKWVTPKSYKITYKLNGGKQPSGYKKAYTSGKGYVLPKPTKKGYTFAGWYTDAKCTKGKTSVIKPWITGNKTYYAKWIRK